MVDVNIPFVPSGRIAKIDPSAFQGLRDSFKHLGEVKREEAIRQETLDRVENMKKEALAAYQTGDPNAMMEFAVKNPEFSEAMKGGINFKNKQTEDNYFQSGMAILEDPSIENVERVTKARQEFLKTHGAEDTALTDNFKEKFLANPKQAIDSLKMELPTVFPKRYKEYREALTGGTKPGRAHSKVAKAREDYTNGWITEDEMNHQINLAEHPSVTPYTSLGKLKTDFNNGLYTAEQYKKELDKIINPKSKTIPELTREALDGNEQSKQILERMREYAAQKAEDQAMGASRGKMLGLEEFVDIDGTARAIYEGRETFDRVKNTFGVLYQERIRKAVLDLAEQETGKREFDFVTPSAIRVAKTSSLTQQEKNRGSMRSFIQNMDEQITEVTELLDGVNRSGVRAVDKPWREVVTRALGSGSERVVESYLKEISNEATKLSQNATGSVALLPEAARQEWERIHDVNLSLPELKKVLTSTRKQAQIRLESVEDNITRTLDELGNINKQNRPTQSIQERGDELQALGMPKDDIIKTLKKEY